MPCFYCQKRPKRNIKVQVLILKIEVLVNLVSTAASARVLWKLAAANMPSAAILVRNTKEDEQLIYLLSAHTNEEYKNIRI